MPELAAHMLCSRTPQAMLRLTYAPFPKIGGALHQGLGGGRQIPTAADQPWHPVRKGLTTLFDAERVAIGPSDVLKTGMSLSHPSGVGSSASSNLLRQIRERLPVGINFSCHSASHLCPRSTASRMCFSA